MSWKFWKRILLIMLGAWIILGVLVIGLLLVERVRGKISLAHYKRELNAAGIRLSPAEFLPKPAPNEDNSAPELWTVLDQLPKDTITTTNTPPKMRLLPSGRAVVCFREDFWADDQNTNRWNEVADELVNNQEKLKQIQALLQKPLLRNRLDYEAGPKMLFPHLIKAKKLTYWFGTSSQLALHEGRKQDALEALLTQLRIPRSLAEDRILISELVRVAIAAIARNDTWATLQANNWTDKELKQIQEAWEQLEFATAMTRALEGEIVFAETTFVIMRKSNEETASFMFGLEEFLGKDESEQMAWEKIVAAIPGGDEVIKFLKHQVYTRIWRFAWLDQDEEYYLRFLRELLESARRAAKAQSMPELNNDTEKLALRLVDRNFYDRLRFPSADSASSVIRAMARAMRQETERSLCISALAIKRYQIEQGRLPETLESLLPDLLSSVPMDYMDGKPMKYRLNSDGQFLLYSAGEDGQDDNGSLALRPGKSSERNPWDRKDFVWPAPATQQELDDYHRKGNQ